MRVVPTAIPDVLVVEPRVFGDQRGFFFESWNRSALREAGTAGEKRCRISSAASCRRSSTITPSLWCAMMRIASCTE